MKTVSNSKKALDRLLEGICVGFLLLSIMLPCSLQARPADYVNLRNVRDFNLGTWTGAGSLSQTDTFCLASANDNSQNPRGGALVMPYQVKVESNDLPAGDYYVFLDGNAANTGNKRIRVTIAHRDIYDGNSFEQLTAGVYDSHAHNGAFRGCRANGNNSQVRVDISALEMAGKFSGTYVGNFSITAIGGSSGTATDLANFQIIVVIQASPEVQISSLDNLALGTHAGLGNINAEENFCVYSTSASGSYSLSVSSSNQDGGGNFFLDSVSGLGQIPYDLYFIDQGNGPGSVKITSNTLYGFGNSSDQFCNGQNNATFSVSIQESELQKAKSGTYQDSLIILVAPQ